MAYHTETLIAITLKIDWNKGFIPPAKKTNKQTNKKTKNKEKLYLIRVPFAVNSGVVTFSA